MSKNQRTTFDKLQRERARQAKQAEKRERRQARRTAGEPTDRPEGPDVVSPNVDSADPGAKPSAGGADPDE